MPICEPESIDEGLPPSLEERLVAMEAPPAAAPARHRRRRYLWVLFAALVTVVCAVGWLAVGILVHDGSAAVAPTRLEPLTFEFQAVQRQDHLLLTWNRAAKSVRDATAATLTIHDGPESEDVALDLDTLRRGGADYYPVFEDVSFGLTLTHTPGGSVSEQAHASLRP
jgi:hypothetical protein